MGHELSQIGKDGQKGDIEIATSYSNPEHLAQWPTLAIPCQGLSALVCVLLASSMKALIRA
jgi:hypothetical protein